MSRDAVICVPARNEREELPSLLRALAAQDSAQQPKVLLLANNCTDGTAALARAISDRRLELRVLERNFPDDVAHAGTARGAAMAAGAAWLREIGAEDGILIATDADATPPPSWLRANIVAMMAGADAVGGRIVPEDSARNPLPRVLKARYQEVERYWAAVRALSDWLDPLLHDPPPHHGSHTGGSLAVTLAAFQDVGGIPALRSGEDNAFVAALEEGGWRLRHDPAVWTVVSARRTGRADGGMAAEMLRWEQAGDAPMRLPAARFWQAVASRRRQIRQLWGQSGAALAGMSAEELAAIGAGSRNDIAFVARVEKLLPHPPAPQQDIRDATAEMEAMAAQAILAA